MRNTLYVLTVLILLQTLTFAQNELLIPYRNGNTWGYCDSSGNIKIATQYDSACFFKVSKKKRSAEVYIQRKAGIIDDKGNIIVPANFSEVSIRKMESEQHCFVTIDRQNKWGLYIGNKQVLPNIYNKLWEEKGDCFVVTSNKKRGLYNAKGKQVIPIIYKTISFIKVESKIAYYKAENETETVIYKDSVLFDKEYESEKNYDDVAYSAPDHQFQIDSIKLLYKIDKMDLIRNTTDAHAIFSLEKNGLKGFWVLNNKKIVKPKYDDIVFSVDIVPTIEKKYGAKHLIAVMKDGKYGIFNEDGKIIYPFEYDDMITRLDNIIILKKGDKKGATILNRPGKDIPVKFDYLEKEYYEPIDLLAGFTILRIKINGRTGYVGENGIEYFKD